MNYGVICGIITMTNAGKQIESRKLGDELWYELRDELRDYYND